MQQPLLIRTVATGLSNSGDRYASLLGGTGWAADSATPRVRVPVAGAFSGFRVSLGLTLTTGTYVFTVVVNGTPSAMSVTLTSGESGEVYAGSDLSVSAGDEITVLCSPSGTPDSLTSSNVSLGIVFAATDTTKGVIFSGHSSSASNVFLAPGVFNSSGTETNVQVVMPTAGVITDIYVNRRSALGGGTNAVYALKVNGSASSPPLSATVTDPSLNGNGTCAGVTVAAGDLISIGITNNGGAASTGCVSLDWTPTVAGEALVFGGAVSSSVSDSVDTFVPFGVAGQATEANAQVPAPMAFTAKKLYVNVKNAPTSGKNRVQHLMKGGVAQTQTCTIADTATKAQDTTHTDAISAGDLLDVRTTPSGTPAGATSMFFSMVATTVSAPAATTRRLSTLGVG